MAHDYYVILGVPRDATPAQIKDAYWRIARRAHPDHAPDDPQAAVLYRTVTEAYNVLSDEEKRRIYDFGFQPVSSVADLFARHPAGRRVMELMLPSAPAVPQRGVDLLKTIVVAPHVLAQGGTVTFSLTSQPGRPSEVTINLPSNMTEQTWCRLPFLGSEGKNGADSGDLWIHLVPEEDNQRR